MLLINHKGEFLCIKMVFKNYLMGLLFLLIIACTSKDSSNEYVEEQEVDNTSKLDDTFTIDEHTIGHVFHAMGVVHSKNDRKSLGKNIKVFIFLKKMDTLKQYLRKRMQS